MGLYHETEGDNDFASIFPSVAEERRVAAEREQADMLLRLLDDLEEREKPRAAVPVEYLRVAANGDVIHDKIDEEKRGRVMTVDQLPKESEYEMLFGKQPEEPQLKVETGLRLRDGKPSQLVKLDDFPLFSLPSNIRFESILVIGAVVFLILVLISRFVRIYGARKRREQHFKMQNDAHEKHLDFQKQHMEQEIERRVRERLSMIFVQANNNMC